MGRVNAFGTIRNDYTAQSVGGRRGNSNSVSAWLNTDTCDGTYDLTASAQVYGHGLDSKERRRVSGGGDQRKVDFTVELPKKAPSVRVFLRLHAHDPDQIPHVVLPGGCTLEYALNCVNLVNQLGERKMSELVKEGS